MYCVRPRALGLLATHPANRLALHLRLRNYHFYHLFSMPLDGALHGHARVWGTVTLPRSIYIPLIHAGLRRVNPSFARCPSYLASARRLLQWHTGIRTRIRRYSPASSLADAFSTTPERASAYPSSFIMQCRSASPDLVTTFLPSALRLKYNTHPAAVSHTCVLSQCRGHDAPSRPWLHPVSFLGRQISIRAASTSRSAQCETSIAILGLLTHAANSGFPAPAAAIFVLVLVFRRDHVSYVPLFSAPS
ncbi:hypothetical protein C8Q74DRAFT_387 [Fomes fomentarius]|nr:hypothetical protein C8Q74DRAFT_387 [Fomes fomentarius]